jgi:uncharacterized protein YoxC
MKRSVITVALALCALAVTVSAQKVHSMTGCLKNGTEANTYMLTDVEGGGPKTVGIVSSADDLAPHVGHKIEVTGTEVAAETAEKDKNVPHAEHYMKLTAVKMLSATCP